MLILFLWLLLCLEEFAPIIVEIQVEQICFGLWESLTFRMIYQCHTDTFYKSCAWLKLVEKIARLQKHKISRLLRTWPLIPTHQALRTFSTRSKKLLLTFISLLCNKQKKKREVKNHSLQDQISRSFRENELNDLSQQNYFEQEQQIFSNYTNYAGSPLLMDEDPI